MTIQDRREVNDMITFSLLLDKTAQIIEGLTKVHASISEIDIKLKGVKLGKETN